MAKKSERRVDAFTKAMLKELSRAPAPKKEEYHFESRSPLVIRHRPRGALDLIIYQRIRPDAGGKSKAYKRKVAEWHELDALGIDQVRKRASALVSAISSGDDPLLAVDAVQHVGPGTLTLAQAFESMIKAGRSGAPFSHSHVNDATRAIEKTFGDWRDRPCSSITRDDIFSRFMSVSSPAMANKEFRILSGLFSFLDRQYEGGEFSDNPVTVISKRRAWHKIQPRRVRLHTEDMGDFMRAIFDSERNRSPWHLQTGRDNLLIILLTGLRAGMANGIKLSDVDTRTCSISISPQQSKNGKPYDIPLSDAAGTLIKRRVQMLSAKGVAEKGWLFPSTQGAQAGHYRSNAATRRNINRDAGTALTSHDLRRTFKSLGAELRIPGAMLDDLCCHSRQSSLDLHYQIFDKSAMKAATQEITDHLSKASGVNLLEQIELMDYDMNPPAEVAESLKLSTSSSK